LERTPAPIEEEAGWVSGPVKAFCRREKNLSSVCIGTASHSARFLVDTSTTLSIVLPLGAVFAVITPFVR